jgi:hypothetical protein
MYRFRFRAARRPNLSPGPIIKSMSAAAATPGPMPTTLRQETGHERRGAESIFFNGEVTKSHFPNVRRRSSAP